MVALRDLGVRRFEDKVAIVTGAGRGIGFEYAKCLASEGAKVAIAEIRADDAQKAAGSIVESGGIAIAVHTDVSREDSVGAMAETVAAEFGGIDLLVNNAALYGDREPWDAMTGPVSYWDRTFAVNLTSVLLCTRAVVPHMERRGGGAIVNQSSGAAFHPNPHLMPYSVTKLAVVSVTYAFATLLGPSEIRVNCICPGSTDTEAYQKQVVDRGMEDRILATLPLKRRGLPSDQAAAVLFLLSDDASYITGQALNVDGGSVMRF